MPLNHTFVNWDIPITTFIDIKRAATAERINAPIARGVGRNFWLVFIISVIKNNEIIYSVVSIESFRFITKLSDLQTIIMHNY